MKKTSGSRTYPVEYTYDSQGRMQTMKTWQSVSGGITALTTGNYDGARGWLAAKDYADATTGNAGTTGNDYLYSDAGRLRTNQLARIVSGAKPVGGTTCRGPQYQARQHAIPPGNAAGSTPPGGPVPENRIDLCPKRRLPIWPMIALNLRLLLSNALLLTGAAVGV